MICLEKYHIIIEQASMVKNQLIPLASSDKYNPFGAMAIAHPYTYISTQCAKTIAVQ